MARKKLSANSDEHADASARQQQECDALRVVAAGRGTDVGELRAANGALQQELESWRAACDFLEAQPDELD